jgi:hypothetical protein
LRGKREKDRDNKGGFDRLQDVDRERSAMSHPREGEEEGESELIEILASRKTIKKMGGCKRASQYESQSVEEVTRRTDAKNGAHRGWEGRSRKVSSNE